MPLFFHPRTNLDWRLNRYRILCPETRSPNYHRETGSLFGDSSLGLGSCGRWTEISDFWGARAQMTKRTLECRATSVPAERHIFKDLRKIAGSKAARRKISRITMGHGRYEIPLADRIASVSCSSKQRRNHIKGAKPAQPRLCLNTENRQSTNALVCVSSNELEVEIR